MNLRLLGVIMPSFILACLIRFEVEFSMLKFARMPYQQEAFLGLALLAGTLAIIRSMNRWGALALVKSIERKGRAKFGAILSQEGKRWTILFHLAEVLISFVFAGFFYLIMAETQPLAIVVGLMGLEQMLFLVFGLRNFGIVVSNDEVVVSGRALNIISLHHLRSVEMLHDDIHFIDIKGKTKKLDRRLIPEDRKDEFASTLKEILEERNTFVSSELF